MNLQNSKISHLCLIKIQSIYSTLKTAEKKAVDFILSNPESVVSLSIVEVAHLAGCSEATFVRVSKKLGFLGFIDLKATLLNDNSEDDHMVDYEISVEDSPISITEKIFQSSKQSLDDTLNLIDENQYMQALAMIKNAKKIIFAGAGDAYSVAYAGYLKFSRIGFNVGCSKDYDVQIIDVSKLIKNDLLIVVSHSGKTHTIYNIVKMAKNMDANVIAITNYPYSPIAKHADIVFLTATFLSNAYGEIMTKRIPELCIIETLYVNTLVTSGRQMSKILSNTNKSLMANKI